MAISIRNILREGTADQHKKIEADLDFLNKNLDLEQYAVMIEKYAGFYHTLEQTISSLPDLPSALEWPLRKKLPLLHSDLERLGRSLSYTIADQPKIPFFSSKSELLGVLYVIEGSTLGGQLLSKHFEKAVSVTKDNGGRFFFGYGPETGKMWQKFVAALESEITTETQAAEALQAARSTFERLASWMRTKSV